MGREQDSGETERESVWQAVHGGKGQIASVIKWAVGVIHLVRSMWDQFARLIRFKENVNDLDPMVSIHFIRTNDRDIMHDDKSHISHKLSAAKGFIRTNFGWWKMINKSASFLANFFFGQTLLKLNTMLKVEVATIKIDGGIVSSFWPVACSTSILTIVNWRV